MFLEKQEPITDEKFIWFDDVGNPFDFHDSNMRLQLSNINEYIVEINQNEIPQFLKWLLINEYKIYCVSDCRNKVKNMSNVQRILFERTKAKENWISFENEKNLFLKEFVSLKDIELIWNTYFLFSKERIERHSIFSIIKELNIFSLGFPNLSFSRVLPIHKELMIGKVSWGESYFKPGTDEEPVILICYTATRVVSDKK